MPALLAESVSVHLEAGPTQKGSGLVVRLGLRNEGKQPVELLNPFDSAQLLIVDGNGFPMKLPRTAPALLVNTKGQTKPEVQTAFPVLRAQRNGLDWDVAELTAPTVAFEPGDSYTVCE